MVDLSVFGSMPVVEMVLGLLCFLFATFIYDVVHYLLHRCMDSHLAALRFIGVIHGVHHQFLDSALNQHDEAIKTNLRLHVSSEFLIHVLVISCFLPLLSLTSLLLAWGLALAFFVYVLFQRGADWNHRVKKQFNAYRPSFFCSANYHLLHHGFPNAYFSSWFKTLDYWLKTGVSLRGRRIAIGHDGSRISEGLMQRFVALGADVLVLNMGAVNSVTDFLQALTEERVDILLLCHRVTGDVNSYERFCACYLRGSKRGKVPKEVWAVDDPFYQRSLSPRESSKRRKRWRRAAKALYRSKHVIYRHLYLDLHNPSDKRLDQVVNDIRRGFNIIKPRTGIRGFLTVFWFTRFTRSDKGFRTGVIKQG